MASSDVARFLRKQYLSSLDNEGNSESLDPILGRFKAVGKKLEANSTALTNPESISSLSDLNEALTQWRNLKKQNKSTKRIFSAINPKLIDLENLVSDASSSSAEPSQPNLLLLDRYTFFKPDPITCIEDVVSVKLEKWMVEWLLTPGDDFKAVGIWGMAGSGKAALVKNVLKQEPVGHKLKLIIWACLSELNCEEEIDDGIVKYLLYRLGLDTDSLVGNVHEDRVWLMEEVERRLQKSRNYILVLDDMWLCSKWFIDVFLGTLKKNRGGAVIATSRRKTVAETIGDKNMLIHLNPREPFGKMKQRI